MDQSNKVKDRAALERDAKSDSRKNISSVITATLAIAGIGIPTALPEVSSIAERIDAIQNAVESGVMKLQPISPPGGASLQGRMMAFEDNSAPVRKDAPKPPPK